MKNTSPTVWWIYVFCWFVSAGGAREPEPDRDDPLQMLVYYVTPMDGDSSMPESLKDPLRIPKFQAKLDQIENVNERLLDLFERDLAAQNMFWVQSSAFALEQRKDLTPEQVRRLTKHLGPAEITKTRWEFEQSDEAAVAGVLNILKNYPSPENVELAAKFLASPDSLVADSAMMTLVEIGGAEHLETMRKLIEKVPVVGPPFNIRRNMRVEAYEKLKARVAASHSKPNEPNGQVVPTAKGASPTQHQSETMSAPGRGNPGKGTVIAWLAVVLAASGLIWMALRARKE